MHNMVPPGGNNMVRPGGNNIMVRPGVVTQPQTVTLPQQGLTFTIAPPQPQQEARSHVQPQQQVWLIKYTPYCLELYPRGPRPICEGEP